MECTPQIAILIGKYWEHDDLNFEIWGNLFSKKKKTKDERANAYFFQWCI